MTATTPDPAAIGDRTVAAVTTLITAAADFGLPLPSETLVVARSKLEEATYTVLVVGEAKRGKSTFVNALAGSDLLPTDVDIATSQVFKVSRGEEAYRLRFEDGSAKEIGPEDLSRYGCQVVIDEHGQPRLDQTIRWIEVGAPGKFLPDGVELCDTPGVGGRYAAHAEVTHRFLPFADAVICVLDSAQPVTEAELEMLARILKHTPNVFFVQTKIDQHGKEAWEEVRTRSEQILRERFGDRLADARIWPFSSKNLQRAATTEKRAPLLLVSRYDALATALQEFLARLTGAARAAHAVALAARYHASMASILSARRSSLTSASSEAALAALAERRQRFAEEWGPRGDKRAALASDAKRALSVGRQGFRDALQAGGTVMRNFEQRIEAAQNIEELNELGTQLSEELVEAAMDEWRKTQEITEGRLAVLLASFLDIADEVRITPATEAEAPILKLGEMHARQFTLFEQLQMGYSGTMVPIGLGGTAATVLGVTVAWWFAVPAIAFGLMQAQSRKTQTQVTATKNEAQKLLRQGLQELQQHFFGVDLERGRYSCVEEYFGEIERAFSSYVNDAIRQKLEEAQAEMQRLEAQSALEAHDREAEVAKLDKQLADWEAIGMTLKELASTPDVEAALADLLRPRPTAVPDPGAGTPEDQAAVGVR